VREDEVGLKELARTVWRNRRIMLAFTFTGVAIAIVGAVVQPDMYVASVTISAVANSSNSNRYGGASQQVGGLASLVGLSLGNDTNKSESLAVLQSELLTERYIRDNDLLPILYANSWESWASRWRFWSTAPPTLWKVSRQFERIRKIADDKKTGLTTLAITWKDPALAARWANGLVKLTNDELRAKAVEESEKHIAYLTDQATKTDIAQVRTAIYTILESEIKNLMLAKGPGDFALRVLDPAIPPERKSWPMRFLWIIGGFLGGFFVALLFVFVRDTWRADTENIR
jgi:uncharacterized protein involved in exopolysaccharide biosynthesis